MVTLPVKVTAPVDAAVLSWRERVKLLAPSVADATLMAPDPLLIVAFAPRVVAPRSSP